MDIERILDNAEDRESLVDRTGGEMVRNVSATEKNSFRRGKARNNTEKYMDKTD
ncbi:MAG: hypothetical protein LBP79_00960 [Clostridiales bacterium]|nr:hypothetical protein [Clostridiales bacterium]